jgi:hypothetical protein
MLDLIAGPWVGEFGWELFGWQGVLRNLAPDYDKVIVYGKPGHAYLYEDFADEYINFIPRGKEPNMWMNGTTNFLPPFHSKKALWIKPQQFTFIENPPQQAFMRYGTQGVPKEIDIVYHARSLTKYGSGYMTWDDKNWMELLNGFDRHTIACIGAEDGASYYSGADFRGANIKVTCDILSRTKVLVGPSSGPIHLGSLCETPHVVWSGHYMNKDRYEAWWNPFNTKLRTIVPPDSPWENKVEWQPKPNQVAEKIEELLCEA